jgi:hypothetical protein
MRRETIPADQTAMEVKTMTTTTESYKGWNISVTSEKNLCANFSFDITDPAGRSQHISLGGDNEGRALERAREMIDTELTLAADE